MIRRLRFLTRDTARLRTTDRGWKRCILCRLGLRLRGGMTAAALAGMALTGMALAAMPFASLAFATLAARLVAAAA